MNSLQQELRQDNNSLNEEAENLVDNINRLTDYRDSKEFSSLDGLAQIRIKRQLEHMNDYRDVLQQRIDSLPS